ncbi:unnamed protein product [Paramecium sonneborni]|uniref:Transmembrane protein n=1 Tax=Paramecium sonneborni TaxID=65129 RepID=A0A8S1JXF0_9CILI|nr:unnamed protein product [Paramecium sonneborni]
MEKFKKFFRGYLQTMLYGIEIRPKYKVKIIILEQMDYSFYIILHTINQFQLLAIIIQTSNEKRYIDFKLDFVQSFLEFFLVNNLIKQSLSYYLAYIIIVISFLSQLVLFVFLCFSTLIRLYTANLIKSNNKGNLNSNIQNWVIQFNELLHWIFVTYPVLYLQIAVLSFSTLSCNSLSLIPFNECEIIPLLQVFSIIQLLISFINGQILIYTMRNHKFNEINSLKRRYSSLLLFNNTIVLAIIFFHYNYQFFEFSDAIKYILANLFTINQIIDQLNNYPYRDPVRLPAITMTFVQFWIVSILTLYRFTSFIQEQQLFFFMILPLPLIYMIGQGLAQQFQFYAIINSNSKIQIKEKHLIITADYFYKLYLDYNKSQESQIKFQQFVKIHRQFCKNKKCYSQDLKFRQTDLDQKKDLHLFSLSIIKCIFKTAQQWLFTLANQNQDLQFEQLQLQYISFVSDIAQKPLLGYLELRRYQNSKNNNNSIYFIEITNKLADQLQLQILDNQQRQTSKDILIQEQKSQLIEISLQQQWWTQNLYENLLSDYVSLLDLKVEHWNNLMVGYQSLNPFQQNTQQLCGRIKQLKIQLDKFIGVPEEWFDLKVTTSKGHQIKKLSHAQLNINCVTLKLYSLFYSIMMNDFDRSFYIEQYVKDLTSNDRQKEIDIIDNLSLLNDRTTIILVSLVKNKGKIVNKNQLALANFFSYIDSNNFKDNVSNIHKLLPKSIMAAHELLIDQFMQRGFSQFFVKKISGYYENAKGFIQKSYIKLGNLFEELDDYVLTASMLKCNLLNQTILFDIEGKIIGISEKLYEIAKRFNPQIQVDFFKEFCRVFLIFPSILTTLKQMEQENKQKLDEFLLENEDTLLYIPSNLIELNSLYIKEQYDKFGQKVDFGLESENLSSWRSWKSMTKSIQSSENCQEKNHLFKITNQDNIDFTLQFIQTHRELFQQFTILKTKVKLFYQQLKVKSFQYNYFILELDHIIEINSEHKNFQKYPSINKIIEFQLNVGQTVAFNKTSYPDSHYDSLDRSINNFNQNLNQQPYDQQYIKELRKQQISNNQNEKQKHSKFNEVKSKGYEEKLNDEFNNLSLTIQRDKGPQLYQIPLQKMDQEDEFELQVLDGHFKQFEQDQEMQLYQKQSSIIRNFGKDKDESQIEIDENQAKNSSNQDHEVVKADLIEILKINRQQKQNNHEHDEEENKQRSVSSSRTSSSKSPSMLIRQLYSINTFQGNIKLIVLSILLIALLFLSLVFIKMQIVQENYNVLQTNINYVTFPETLNFYFIKATYFTWVQLTQESELVTYSEFIQTQIEQELQQMKEIIDVKLNELYQGIIQYENQIITNELKLININEYEAQTQQLDLTQLIQLIQIHAFNFIDNFKNITSFKDILFFRLNMPFIYQFAYKYITLLNENLVYYEEKIINDVIQITMIILALITAIIMYITFQISNVTLYEKQILMLISRVSYKAAEEAIDKLLDIKSVLSEPTQLVWKKINFFDLNYESKENNSDQNKMMVAKSLKTTSATRSNYQTSRSKSKSKRNYQSNSLAQRIYDLSLINKMNYIYLLAIWLIFCIFVIGSILVTVNQVSDIKPTLNLNLQLIRFKFRFDSLIVYSEIIKSEKIIEKYFLNQYQELDMQIDVIIELFNQQYDGFQDSMKQIYDSLIGNSGLMQAQKIELLMYFEQSLCNFMSSEIPFCNIQIKSDANFSVPQNFIDEYGQPVAEDNNYEYVSGGIINMVQEFSKNLQMYYYTELVSKKLSNDSLLEISQYLRSKVHITQQVEYFLDTGKLLSTVGYNLFEQNQSKLNQATTLTQIYVYLTGFSMFLFFILISYYWIKQITTRLQLMRLSLTLIPYDILLEAKTISSLKQL